MTDLLNLADELILAGSSASADLWDRFAEAVDQEHRQQEQVDTIDYWVIQPDEPADFAAQYPAAPGRITERCQ